MKRSKNGPRSRASCPGLRQNLLCLSVATCESLTVVEHSGENTEHDTMRLITQSLNQCRARLKTSTFRAGWADRIQFEPCILTTALHAVLTLPAAPSVPAKAHTQVDCLFVESAFSHQTILNCAIDDWPPKTQKQNYTGFTAEHTKRVSKKIIFPGFFLQTFLKKMETDVDQTRT